MRTVPLLLLFLLSFSGLHADGKMYRLRETVPANIPYQRALIFHRDSAQTMLLQSSYRLPPDAPPDDLAWVIPLPAVPGVAALVPGVAEDTFFWLDRQTVPQIVVPMYIPMLSLLPLVLVVNSMILVVFRAFRKKETKKNRTLDLLIALGPPAFIWLILAPGFTRARSSPGVEVIREQRVGVYDVTILRAHEGNPLLDWLRERNFPLGAGDLPVLDAHIARGGCFVTARINPGAVVEGGEAQRNGLASPLVFHFPSEHPFYPLALTGTGGHETEVLIYLVSDQPWDAQGRLTLRYAGNLHSDSSQAWDYLRLPENQTAGTPAFLSDLKTGFTRLHKFKSRLSPGQMREDLVFSPAPGQQDFREQVIRW